MSTLSVPPHSAPSLPLPPEALRRSLKKRLGQLSLLPHVAVQAMRVVDDPDASGRDVAKVIERDAHLAASLLAMANSSLFGSARTATTLHEAIFRIGFTRCKQLILAAGVQSVQQQIPPSLSWMRETLWAHGVTTGIAAVHLNRLLQLGFQGEEFACGLLHDFGRTLLAVADADLFQRADALTFEESPQICAREQALIGTDHCEFGGWFARESGLPSTIVEAITYHHHPDPPAEQRVMTTLIAAADDVANHLQRHQDASFYDPQSNPAIPRLVDAGHPEAAARFAEFGVLLVTETAYDVVAVMKAYRTNSAS